MCKCVIAVTCTQPLHFYFFAKRINTQCVYEYLDSGFVEIVTATFKIVYAQNCGKIGEQVFAGQKRADNSTYVGCTTQTTTH